MDTDANNLDTLILIHCFIWSGFAEDTSQPMQIRKAMDLSSTSLAFAFKTYWVQVNYWRQHALRSTV